MFEKGRNTFLCYDIIPVKFTNSSQTGNYRPNHDWMVPRGEGFSGKNVGGSGLIVIR
jgi:hypothetical protein